jgi:hypothetical protein
MSTCAIEISENCTPRLPKRGICSSCYKHLVRTGVLENKEYKNICDYPEWLQFLIREQDMIDHRDSRHVSVPHDEERDKDEESSLAQEISLGLGCKKLPRHAACA